MQSIVETVDRVCQDLERQITDLERYVGMLQSTPLGAGVNSLQIAQIENIIASLKNELLGPELAIVGVEQTQATQYFSINGQGSGYAPDNSVPLIAQRALILRVYVNNRRGPQSTVMHVTGQVIVDRLHTFGPETRVATLSPINGPIVARSSASIDRGNPNHTLNFRLKSVQCQGHLRFRVTVREQTAVLTQGASLASEHSTSASSPIARSIESLAPDSTIASPEGPSPTMVVHGRFEQVPTFRVRAVLIHYTGGGMDIPAPSGLDFAKTLDYVLGTYPIGRREFSDCVEVEYDGDLSAPGAGCGGWEALVNLLLDMEAASDDNAIYVALVPPGASNSNILGCGNTAVAAAKVGDGAILAQEMGHAFSRKHAPGAPGADPDFPTYDSYPAASIGEFGFDTRTSEVYDPAQSFDFMSYRPNKWISPYTYMALRDAMVERFGNASMAMVRLTAGARRDTLFLNFRVNRDGTVHVFPGFHLLSVVQPSRRDYLSELSCELLDQSGTVLTYQRCRLTEKHQDRDGPHVVFHEAIPWIEQAAAIRFLRNREVLHVHEIEETAPKVEIRSPKIQCNDKAMTLEWIGHHVENELTYMIRYSNDGGATWQVVAANLRDAACQVRLRLMSGGDRCLLQVVASSGIRTSVAQTEPFASPLKLRTAFILSPERKTEVPVGGQVVLRGGAFSPDFGLGDMEDVVWNSNLDGLLGRGFELVADNLSSGFHTITLTVPDGVGGVATASVSLRVSGD